MGLTRSQDAEVVRGGGGATLVGTRVLYSQDWILVGGSDPASLPTPLSFNGLSVSRLWTLSFSSSTLCSSAVSIPNSWPSLGSGVGIASVADSGVLHSVRDGADIVDKDTDTGTGAAVTPVTRVGTTTLGPVSFLVSTGLGGRGGGLGLVAGLGAAAACSAGG